MNGQELPLWVVIPAAVLMVTGGLAALIGGIGLLRMRDFYSNAVGRASHSRAAFDRRSREATSAVSWATMARLSFAPRIALVAIPLSLVGSAQGDPPRAAAPSHACGDGHAASMSMAHDRVQGRVVQHRSGIRIQGDLDEAGPGIELAVDGDGSGWRS